MMSGSRMKVAGRFKHCRHLGCFDLHVFLEMNQQSRKWQCPSCLKNYSSESIIIDPYFNRITSKMQDCDDDVTDVEIKPDSSWRARVVDQGSWHHPDGTLSAAQPMEEVEQIVPQARTSSRRRNRRDRDECRVLSKPDIHRVVSPCSDVASTSKIENDVPVVREGTAAAEIVIDGGNRDFSGTSGLGSADVIILIDDSDDENDGIGAGPEINEIGTGPAASPLPSHGMPESGQAGSTFWLFGWDQVIPVTTPMEVDEIVPEYEINLEYEIYPEYDPSPPLFPNPSNGSKEPLSQPEMSDDWISLAIGGGAWSPIVEPVAEPSSLVGTSGGGSSRRRKSSGGGISTADSPQWYDTQRHLRETSRW